MPDATVEWLTPVQLDAWVNLIKLSSRIVTLADGELRRAAGITGRDYELLHHLSMADDGHRINDLAEFIDDSSSCITHRVNRLQRAGLVDKRGDPTDGRVRRVRLTPAGRALLAEAAPAHAARVRRWVVDPLTDRDLRHVARIAATLHDHLRAVEPLTA